MAWASLLRLAADRSAPAQVAPQRSPQPSRLARSALAGLGWTRAWRRVAAALAFVLGAVCSEPVGLLPVAWAQGQVSTEAQRFRTQSDGVERSTDTDLQGRPRSAFTLPPVTSAHCLPGRHWELAGGVAGCVCDGDANHTRVSNDQPTACQSVASPLPSITVARGGTVFGLGDGGYLQWSTRDATSLSMSCKDGTGTVYVSLGGLSGGLSWSYDVAGVHSCTWVAIGPGGSKTLVEGFSVGGGTPTCSAQAARCEGSALVQRDSCGQALATWANHASCAPTVTCTSSSFTQSELCASPLSGTLTRLYNRTTCTDGSVTDTLASQSGSCTSVSSPTKTCADGSVIALSDACPVLTRTCPDGTVRPLSVACPDSPPQTRICPDGRVIPVTEACSPLDKVCPDGRTVSPAVACPDMAPECTTQTVAVAAACPTGLAGAATSLVSRLACTDGRVVDTWLSTDVSGCHADRPPDPTYGCVGSDWVMTSWDGITTLVEANSTAHGCYVSPQAGTRVRVAFVLVDWDGSGYPMNWDFCVRTGGPDARTQWLEALQGDPVYQATRTAINESAWVVGSCP